MRSILDLGDRVVEDVEWAPGDFEVLVFVTREVTEPPARRAVAILVLAEHFAHRVGALFVGLACEDSDASVIAAAMSAEGQPTDPASPDRSATRASFCASRRTVPEPTHPNEVRPAIGGTIEPALGYDDETGVIVLGLGLSTRFGIRFPNHLAILVQLGAVAQTTVSSEVRTYLGLGPSLIFDVGFPIAWDSAVHIGVGHGFDYGESVVTSGGFATAVSGVFPTIDLYGIAVVETAFSMGLRLHVAIPTEAPDHFGITGALMFGGETL